LDGAGGRARARNLRLRVQQMQLGQQLNHQPETRGMSGARRGRLFDTLPAMGSVKRKKTPADIEADVVLRSARRCTLCFQLSGDLTEKQGQIAHLDQNPSNFVEDNLVFMCLPHHSLYNSKTSQHKNYTMAEVKAARSRLHEAIVQEKQNASPTISQNFQPEIPEIHIHPPVARSVETVGQENQKREAPPISNDGCPVRSRRELPRMSDWAPAREAKDILYSRA
jgi:hypothetical protein